MGDYIKQAGWVEDLVPDINMEEGYTPTRPPGTNQQVTPPTTPPPGTQEPIPAPPVKPKAPVPPPQKPVVEPEEEEVKPKTYRIREYKTPRQFSNVSFISDVDYSYLALLYLRSLGYNQAFWQLYDPMHTERDICDELRGNTYSIDDLLGNARKNWIKQQHPPAAIFSLTHPGCWCQITCYMPSSENEIPDSAPGLPIYANPEIVKEYKYNLFQSMPTTIEVSSYTLPPDYNFLHEAYANIIERKKIAASEEWVDDIQPGRITKTDVVEIPLGLQQVMLDSDVGFQLRRRDDDSKIRFYSYRFNNVFDVPKDMFSIISLEPSHENEPASGKFARVDDMTGIISRVLDGKVTCYLPELESVADIDTWNILNIS